jgi:uncharacterized protein YdcH (DUF465 family)
MSAAAFVLGELLLTAGINFLIQKQAVDAKIAQARAEGREVTPEELEELKVERDRLYDETIAALDSVS